MRVAWDCLWEWGGSLVQWVCHKSLCQCLQERRVGDIVDTLLSKTPHLECCPAPIHINPGLRQVCMILDIEGFVLRGIE